MNTLPPRIQAIVDRHASQHFLADTQVLFGKPPPGYGGVTARVRRAIWHELRPQFSLNRIALWFGVDHGTVFQACKRPLFPLPTRPPPLRVRMPNWTPAEKALALSLSATHDNAEIGFRLGRTASAVKCQLTLLRREQRRRNAA